MVNHEVDCFGDNIANEINGEHCTMKMTQLGPHPPIVDLVANEVGVVRAVDEIVRQRLAHVL